MPIKVSKMRAKQPLFGTNMPGSAESKHVLGPVDRSPEELRRQSAKMMMGDPEKAASDDSKGVMPNLGEGMAAKGLHGKFEPDEAADSQQESRTARVNAGVKAMQNSGEGFASVDEAATEAPPTFKDWQKIGETPSHMIVAVNKKKIRYGAA